jgi:ribosomal protein S18 acetylase RimI-like enzyme
MDSEGPVYFTKRPIDEYAVHIPDDYTISVHLTISPEDAQAFLQLQKAALAEIKADSLMQKTLLDDNYIFDDLFIVLVKKENVVVGYGFGHFDPASKETYYINFIYVHKSHRGKKLSSSILKAIMNKVINTTTNEKYKYFKAVTQEDNSKAIGLLVNHNFNKVEF